LPKVSNIDSIFEDISTNKDLIVGTVYNLSEEIKNTSISLEQVTDSSLELAKLAEDVNNSSDVLLYKADELIEKVKQFRIEKEDFNYEVILDKEETNIKEMNEKEMKLEELTSGGPEVSMLMNQGLERLNLTEEHLDLALMEELKYLAMPSEDELELEAELEAKDFGWGCCKVTELKEYTKQKEMKEHEDEYEELGNYDISHIV